MEALDCIPYRGYRVDVVADDDSQNPLEEWDGAPTLVLHSNAERRFGWTTDTAWQDRLETALEQIAERGVTHNLYGPSGALSIVRRWLRTFHGIPVVLPVAAIEHSGVALYLGTGEHPHDPGGWDSGWIGWLFATPEQIQEWGCSTPDGVEQVLRGFFAEFAAWVSGDVVGYQIFDPDGIPLEDGSCYGFYGSEGLTEPDGWIRRQCQDVIDADIARRDQQLPLDLVPA